MPADVVVKWDVFTAANFTSTDDSTIEINWTIEGGFESHFPEVFLIVVIVLLLEVVLAPLELP